MAIRLIALDLDGTLLGAKGKVSSETIKILEAAAAMNIEIVPCTGRPYSRIPDEIAQLPVVHYIIVRNGARVYDHRSGSIIHCTELSLDIAEKLFDYAEALPTVITCCQDEVLWIDKSSFENIDKMIVDPWVAQVACRRTPMEDMRKKILEGNCALESMELYFDEPVQGERELHRLVQLFPMCSIVSSTHHIIEIGAQEATKGDALTCLCELLGIDMADCMAIGDDTNDISMLSRVGLGIAMANARESVKKYAKEVTNDNYDDGVAKAIQKYISCIHQNGMWDNEEERI